MLYMYRGVPLPLSVDCGAERWCRLLSALAVSSCTCWLSSQLCWCWFIWRHDTIDKARNKHQLVYLATYTTAPFPTITLLWFRSVCQDNNWQYELPSCAWLCDSTGLVTTSARPALSPGRIRECSHLSPRGSQIPLVVPGLLHCSIRAPRGLMVRHVTLYTMLIWYIYR